MFTTGAEDAVSQAEGLMDSTSWNNRALFLVVVRTPTASPERLAFSVVESLWENARVFNIVILVAPDTTFHLYTWFPYVQHKQCGEVREIVRIKILNEAGNRNITTDIKLFSYQAPKTFWGCPITVSSVYQNDTGEKLLSDFLIRLNFTVTSIYTDFGIFDYKTRVTNAINEFASGISDIAIPIVLNKYLAEFGYISHEVDWVELVWYVPCAKPTDRIQKIATICTTTLWIALIGVLLATGTTMWQLATLSQQDDTYQDISTVLYNTWAVVMGVGVTKMPRSYYLRIVIFALILYCFSISTVFQAFFKTFLVNPGLQKQIANLHELLESKMECGVPPGINLLYGINDELNNISETGYQCDDYKKCVERITDTGNFAMFEDSRYVKYYLASGKKGNKICVMNYYDVAQTTSVALFSRGTQILDQFNKFLTRMLESGEIAKVQKDYWTVSSDFDNEEDTSQQYFVFTISHLLVAFYALAIGHSLGFVTFLLELLHQSYSTYRQRTVRRKITERFS
jgi:hypothetical protein